MSRRIDVHTGVYPNIMLNATHMFTRLSYWVGTKTC